MDNWDFEVNGKSKMENRYYKKDCRCCKKHYCYKGKCKRYKCYNDDIIIKLLCRLEERLEDIEECTCNSIVDLLEEILDNMTHVKKHKKYVDCNCENYKY